VVSGAAEYIVAAAVSRVLYMVRDGIFTSLNPETGDVYKQARLSGAQGTLLVVADRSRRKDLPRQRKRESCCGPRECRVGDPRR
jgi:hypothetical protein